MKFFYKSKFEKACIRNVAFNLKPINIKYSSDRFIDNAFLKRLQHYFKDNSSNYFNGTCLGVHLEIKELVEEWLACEVYLTIGSVKFENRLSYDLTDLDIAEYLSNGIKMPLPIHVWLTLPTMEIIDLTFLVTHGMVNDIKEYQKSGILRYADDIKESIIYNPILIGKEFLEKTGAIRYTVLTDEQIAKAKRLV